MDKALIIGVVALLSLGGCYSLLTFENGPALTAPPVDQIGRTAHAGPNCLMELVATGGTHRDGDTHRRIGDFVPLNVKLTNVGTQDFLIGDAEKAFQIWAFCDNHPVPLTPYGELIEQHHFTTACGGGVVTSVEIASVVRPGETRYAYIRLSAIFRLEKSGTYTVVAEELPVSADASMQDRLKSCVKTTFVIDPEYVNFAGHELLKDPVP